MKLNKWFFFPLLIFGFSLNGQVSVNTLLTAEELVRDVLVNNGCAQTSDHTSFTGIANGFNGIGYFDAQNTSFPFAEGIILSTGRAVDAAGPNVIQNSSGTEQWPGDQDLSSITNINNLFNASYLQFDFIPETNRISFNFIFASEEYFGEFQCFFSDTFAFILTDSSGNSTNLAIVPGTQDPVSVVTIRTGITGLCEPQNRSFFHGVNGPNSDISFHGRTVSLQAVSDVVPGETYNIKLVVADNADTELDSAVFLEAGSFTVAVDLGEDRTVLNGNPLCTGESIELNAESDGATGYKWFRGATELTAFENNPTIMVADSGDYSVEVQFSALCQNTAKISLEFITPPMVSEQPLDLTECEINDNTVVSFDFTENANRILGGQDPSIYQVAFYQRMEDAEMMENEIVITSAYQNPSPTETIYARISSGSSCFEIASFQTNVRQLDVDPNLIEASYPICRNKDLEIIAPLPVIATGLPETEYTFSWFLDTINDQNRIMGETSSSLVANSPGTYFVEIQHISFGCTFVFSTEVVPSDPPETFEIEFINEFFSGSNDIRIIAEGNSEYLFSLDGSEFDIANTFENLIPGEHIAQVTDVNGCTIQSLVFDIIDYPRFFTPNGDNVNDEWKIYAGNNLVNAQISIFNRFGQLLKTLNSTESWDGTFSGNPLPPSDYWFSIAYERNGEEKIFKAHFTLKR